MFSFRRLLLALVTGPLLAQGFSKGAQALVDRAFAGLPDRPIVDIHAHMLGLGRDGSGTWVNPCKLSLRHPVERFKTHLYVKATGARDLDHLDEDYLPRLLARMDGFPRPLRLHLLAFDHAYTREGALDLEHSEFYVPNEAVLAAAEKHPGRIIPVLSIHPYRKDAIPELEKGAARGARYVKWLPNAQLIDARDPRSLAFCARMRDLGLVLITHVGEEKAVHGEEAQVFGNPMYFKPALDLGLRIVMAHCGSLGANEDPEHPGTKVQNFELFMRLMQEPRYRGLLYGDISAIVQVNRLPAPLLSLLNHPELHDRLINGSDYPLPGVDLVIWTRKLKGLGLLTAEERKALNEIFEKNPLLFDFVLKRTLRTKEGKKFGPGIFCVRPELP